VIFSSPKLRREAQSVHQSLSHLSDEAQGGILRVNPQEKESLCFRGSRRDLFRRNQNPSQPLKKGGVWLLNPKSFGLRCSDIFELVVAGEAQIPKALKTHSESTL